jgi:hypothetical protein
VRSNTFNLKGQCHKIFCFRFFHESPCPKSLKITLGQFKFFQNFTEIFSSQGAPPVSTTLVANLPPVLLIPVANLPPVSTNWQQICRQCQRHRWQSATVINDSGSKFSTGVIDPGGKFANNGNTIRLQTP